jgi:basic membrane protein A
VLLLAIAGAAGLPAGSGAAAGPLRVALIAPSARNDHAFTQSMYAALRSMARAYGFKLSVSENQFVVADAAQLIRGYAANGYGLIVVHGSQYGDALRKIAREYPRVSFAWGTSSTTLGLPNVYAYSAAANQGGYVQGYLAALLSSTKVIGEIGPVEVGDAKLYLDGFRAGARAAVRDVVVHSAYTGSFSDPSLMASRAHDYVEARADVLTGSSQAVLGAIAVCKDRNVAWFGTQSSQTDLAPMQVVSSQVYDWRVVLKKILTGVRAGRVGGAAYTITLKNGGEKIEFNPRYALQPGLRAAAQKQIAAIERGTVHVRR